MESCCELVAPANAAVDLTLALSTGLAMSIGHCAGMCGPLVSAFGAAQGLGEKGNVGALRALSLYHAGRLTSYAILGALFGWLGESAGLDSLNSRVGGTLSIAAGLLLLIFVAGLLGWFPFVTWIETRLPWSKKIGCEWGKLLRCRRDPERYAVGFLNGWLPCGPVYALAVVAGTTQRPELGALVMLAFGLGTVPVLSTLSWGAAKFPVKWRMRSQRLGTGFIVLLALQLVARGAAAGGWIGHLRFGEFVVY
jgi:sulfite exporter TauE/SafE